MNWPTYTRREAIKIVEEMIEDTINPYLIDDPTAAKRVELLRSRKAALQHLIQEVRINGNS